MSAAKLAGELAAAMRKSDDIAWPIFWYHHPENFDWVARKLVARLSAADDGTCTCGHDVDDHIRYCPGTPEEPDCGCEEER